MRVAKGSFALEHEPRSACTHLARSPGLRPKPENVMVTAGARPERVTVKGGAET